MKFSSFRPYAVTAFLILVTASSGCGGGSKSKSPGEAPPAPNTPINTDGSTPPVKPDGSTPVAVCDGLPFCGGNVIVADGSTVAAINTRSRDGELFVSTNKASTFSDRTDALKKAFGDEAISDLEILTAAAGDGLLIVGTSLVTKCPTPTIASDDGTCEQTVVLASEDQGISFKRLDLGLIRDQSITLMVTKDGPLVVADAYSPTKLSDMKIFQLDRTDLKVKQAIPFTLSCDVKYIQGQYWFYSPIFAGEMKYLLTENLSDASLFDQKAQKLTFFDAKDPKEANRADLANLETLCVKDKCQTYVSSADGTGIDVFTFNPNGSGAIKTSKLNDISSLGRIRSFVINGQIVAQVIKNIDVEKAMLLSSGEAEAIPADAFPFAAGRQSSIISVAETKTGEIYVLCLNKFYSSLDQGKTWNQKIIEL